MKYVVLTIFLLLNGLALAQKSTALEQAFLSLNNRDDCRTWLQIARRNAADLPTASAYVELGDVLCYQLQDYRGAIALYQRAAAIQQAIKADTSACYSLVRMGIATAGLGDYTKAIKYYEKARTVLPTPRSVKHEVWVLAKLANAYADLGQIPQALAADSLAERLLRNQNFPDLQAENAYGRSQRNMLKVIQSNGADTVALRRAETGFAEARRLYTAKTPPDTSGILLSINGLGGTGYYRSDKRIYQAYIQEGIKLAEASKDTVAWINLLYNWTGLEEMGEHPEQALEPLVKFRDLMIASGLDQDSAFRATFYSQIYVLPFEAVVNPKIFNTYLNERIANLSQLKDQIEGAKFQRSLDRQKSRMQFGSAILVIVVAGGFFFQWQRNRQRLLAKELLLNKEKMESLVADSAARAKEQTLNAETNARLELRRELHDGASAVMAAARWAFEAKIEELEAANNPLAADLRANLDLQNKAYLALRNVIHRSEQDPVSWVDELRIFCAPLPGVELIEYNLEEVPNGKFGRKCLNLTRELIANALKHACATKIEVQLAKLDDLFSITVSDNGQGFDVQTIPVLQQQNDASNTPTLPVENLPGLGTHGLESVHKYVAELGGEIELTSQLGEGTNVFIELPLPKPSL